MSNITKAIAALGVVAGLGVAALPLSTYAADSQPVKVIATIDNQISVAADDTEVNLGNIVIGGAPSQGATNVTVSTNETQGYTLSVKSTNKDAALYLNNAGIIDTTKSITSNATVKQGSTAWGVRGGDLLNWTAVPASTATTGQTIRTTTGAATTGDATKVEFGVSVATGSGLTAGTYEGSVIFTANVNS